MHVFSLLFFFFQYVVQGNHAIYSWINMWIGGKFCVFRSGQLTIAGKKLTGLNDFIQICWKVIHRFRKNRSKIHRSPPPCLVQCHLQVHNLPNCTLKFSNLLIVSCIVLITILRYKVEVIFLSLHMSPNFIFEFICSNLIVSNFYFKTLCSNFLPDVSSKIYLP